MVTRSGSVDPGLMLWLLENTDIDVTQLSNAMEHASGLAGLSGTSGDIRDVVAAMEERDSAAELAWQVFNHRLASLAGQMITSMGGLGFGGLHWGSASISREFAAEPRALLVPSSELSFDDESNRAAQGDALISATSSRVPVVVVTAREDVQIVREVLGRS